MPKPKRELKSTGKTQGRDGELVQAKMKRPIGMQADPNMAGGRRDSGGAPYAPAAKAADSVRR